MNCYDQKWAYYLENEVRLLSNRRLKKFTSQSLVSSFFFSTFLLSDSSLTTFSTFERVVRFFGCPFSKISAQRASSRLRLRPYRRLISPVHPIFVGFLRICWISLCFGVMVCHTWEGGLERIRLSVRGKYSPRASRCR